MVEKRGNNRIKKIQPGNAWPKNKYSGPTNILGKYNECQSTCPGENI